MVFEQRVAVIVMLCSLVENKRVKCNQYWPGQDQNWSSNISDTLVVTVESEQCKNELLTVRHLVLKSYNEERRLVQLHFTKWVDHGVPEIDQVYDTFDYMVKEVDTYFETAVNYSGTHSPVVVHCSAGIGRTGTFISMYNVYYQCKTGTYNSNSNFNFNICNTVRKLKEQRLMMVENVLQYRLVYAYAAKLLTKLLNI